MDGSITVSTADRKTLLDLVRAAVGLRSRQAHLVLLAAEGRSRRDLRAITFASFDFIAKTLTMYRRRGVAAFAEPMAKRPLPAWAKILRRWMTKSTPEDFGFFRRRWSCETLPPHARLRARHLSQCRDGPADTAPARLRLAAAAAGCRTGRSAARREIAGDPGVASHLAAR